MLYTSKPQQVEAVHWTGNRDEIISFADKYEPVFHSGGTL